VEHCKESVPAVLDAERVDGRGRSRAKGADGRDVLTKVPLDIAQAVDADSTLLRESSVRIEKTNAKLTIVLMNTTSTGSKGSR
jgi:hypothetical protein